MFVKIVILFCLLQSLYTDANDGPNNAAVFSGTSVQMRCRNSKSNVASCENASNVSNIYWNFFAVGSKKETEYDKIPPERLLFNKTCAGQFDVIINESRLEDAGTYTCILPDGPEHTAQLIVLDSEPECLVSNVEKDEDAIRCTVKYSGNWPPTVKWQTLRGLELPDNSSITSNSVTSVLKRSTIQIMEGSSARFKWEMYFEQQRNKPSSTPFKVFADNIPTYRHNWTSPEIKVPWRENFLKSTQSTDKVIGHATSRFQETGHSTLIAIMISLFLVVIAFLTTVTTIYFVKKYKKRKLNRRREGPRAMEYYAEVSQRGNMSMDNGSLQLNSIAFQKYDEVSISTRGPPHYPQYRHFEEDDIAAYSETRTIASIPATIKNGKSALSLNKHIPESGSLEMVSRPSVDSAMPVYAEVQKSKNLRKYENDSSSSKWSDATSDRSNDGMIQKGKEPKQEPENVGADGTEYVTVTDKSRDRKKIPLPKDLPKKTKEEAIYIGVDHTRRKPPPPPPFY